MFVPTQLTMHQCCCAALSQSSNNLPGNDRIPTEENGRKRPQYVCNVSVPLNPNPSLVKRLRKLLFLSLPFSSYTIRVKQASAFKALYYSRASIGVCQTLKLIGCALLNHTISRSSNSWWHITERGWPPRHLTSFLPHLRTHCMLPQ